MKKISLFIFVCFVTFLLCDFNLKINAEEVKKLNKVSEEVIESNIDEVEDYFEVKNGNIKVYIDRFVYTYNYSTISIEAKLIDYSISGESIYCLIEKENYQDVICLKKGVKVSNYKINNAIIQKIVVDKNVYLLGKSDDLGIVIELSLDLVEIREHKIDEGVKIKVYNIFKVDNFYYLVITRIGHSSEGNLKNVGNFNDEKTVLLKLNSKFTILSEIYFNNQESSEIPIESSLVDNSIYLVVSLSTKDVYYTINLDSLSIIKQKTYNKCDFNLLSYNLDILRFDMMASLNLYVDNMIYDLEIDGKVLDLSISDNLLKVLYYEAHNIILATFEEYHINTLNDFVIGYDYGNYDFDKNLNDNGVIDIKSYFSDVAVYLNSTFDKTLPGENEVELKISRSGLNDAFVKTKVIVNEYCNILDGYCYKDGKILNFLGKGTLDGVGINSGHIITSIGPHQLVISNKIGEKKIYNFNIIDGYYIKSSVHYDASNSLVVENGEEFYVTLNFKNILLEEVVVNNEVVDFFIDDDVTRIKLRAPAIYGPCKYTINKVKINGEYFNVDKVIEVFVLKDKPKIEINELDNKELSLKIDVIDLDQTILYFRVENNKDVNYSYIIDSTFDVYDGELKVFVCYDLGNGIILSQNIFSLNGELKQNSDILKFDYVVDTSIHEVNIDVATKKFKTIDKLRVSQENVSYDYVVHNNYTNIIISIIITSFVVGIIVFFVFKNKKKKINKTKVNN